MGAPSAPPGHGLELLGHDVRLDGVAFWRIRAPASFRRQLAPGSVVYFLAVVRGRLWLKVSFPQEAVITLSAGDAVSLSGMTQHVFEAGKGRSAEAAVGQFELLDFALGRDPSASVDLMLGVAPHEAMSLANMINGPLVIRRVRDAEYSRHIWKAFDFLEDEYSESLMHFDRDQIVRRMAETISININRAISHRGDARMRGFTARRSKAYDRRMRGIWHSLSMFLERPFEPWSLDALAREAGVSRTSYCDGFRQATGMAPKKSLARIRMALISRRLSAERLPLDEAADIAGYNSAAAFIRAFKREFNTTPGTWRAAQRK